MRLGSTLCAVLAALVGLSALTAPSALAVADGCAVVTATPDGFLSLRTGPSTKHREIMRLYSGQFIGIDDMEGDPKRQWIHLARQVCSFRDCTPWGRAAAVAPRSEHRALARPASAAGC